MERVRSGLERFRGFAVVCLRSTYPSSASVLCAGCKAASCIAITNRVTSVVGLCVVPGTGRLDQTVRNGDKPMLGVTTVNEL
mgnify:CR=1 FL=1